MEWQIQLLGRDLRVALSRAAVRALEARVTPLHVEMELYFSCLIRKRVYFDLPQRGEVALIGQDMSIGFRPVMSRGGCSVADTNPEEMLVDLPTGEPQRFVPHWLKLDYRHGQWQGEFGY
ncbi:MAG: hypothetical protein HXY26_01865 [Hydrogenophilaceae bacterium]|nr:hypothetical protein [Hydrogenophilaceae bacterium]